MFKILKYIMLDILRNRLVLVYTAILSIVSWSVFSLEDSSAKGAVSLLNMILLVVPLFAVIFSNIYMYNASEFIELLLSQPIKRRTIWLGFFGGLGLALVASFLIGVGIPILVLGDPAFSTIFVLTGILINLIFVAVSMLTSVLTNDKAKGVGLSIVIWLMMTLIYDGLLMMAIFQFSEYPIEKPLIALTALNPIDLARILILLQMDASAILGFTGALFKAFFGNTLGMATAFGMMTLWVFAPFYYSLRKFHQKDL